jgi:hypothetical protein
MTDAIDIRPLWRTHIECWNNYQAVQAWENPLFFLPYFTLLFIALFTFLGELQLAIGSQAVLQYLQLELAT